MSDFILGFLSGFLVLSVIIVVNAEDDYKKCAQEHNVYTCERVVEYRPVGNVNNP